MTQFQHFGIIGGGAWGTALAQSLARANRDVTLWAREADVVDTINTTHENTGFLPGTLLSPRIKASTDLMAITQTDVWLFVTPAQHTRAVAENLAAQPNTKNQPILLCSKGIEMGRLLFPHDVVGPVLPQHPLAVLSGPTFAAEVAKGLPTAITLACTDPVLGPRLAESIACPVFRPYWTDDVIGTEVGGAIKNVLAVACGIAAGCQLGDNARAALITRGLAEMMRLGAAMGGRTETLMGLSGLGDLTLTCSSLQSRNMSLGVALGRGETLQAILTARKTVAEGVPTAAAAVALAQKHAIDMPIAAAVDSVLNKGAAVDETIQQLLARPRRAEAV